MASITKAQQSTIEAVLDEWINDKEQVINDPDNYGMDRQEVRALQTQMLNVAIILEDVCGVKDSKKEWSETLCEENILQILSNME